MAETPDEEIDEIVGDIAESSSDDDNDDEGEQPDDSEASASEEEDKPPKKRRVRKSTTRRRTSKQAEAKTLDEMEVDELLPKGLPKPDGSMKSLGDIYAKFGIGTYPDMKVHLYRTYPKIAPGGVKFDGFYDEYDMAITEQQIQSEYGGGQYRVVVVGPNPADPRLPKHYGSHSIGLAGPPNYERMPRALRKPEDPNKNSGASNANPPPHPMVTQQESPKLAEAALKMFAETANSEREERRRMERKIDEERTAALSSGQPLAEAERRRADDLIRAERERSETTRLFYERQLEETKAALMDVKREVERVERARPSMGAELRDLAESGLFGRNDDGAKEMFNRVLEKHREEVAAVNKSHTEFISHLRQGHSTEIAALRSAHEREMSAEREASRSREERIEERLKSEREERERDRVRHREAMEERDRHWKDRLEQSLQTQQSSWEARHQSLTSTYENRIQWLQQEVDKLKAESYELRSKQEEKGDIMTQLLKHKELGSLMKEMGGGDASSSSSSGSAGGLGLSGGSGDDWKGVAVEAAMERMPLILEKLFGGGSPQANQQAAQQMAQQFHEGQVIDTPQGKMEVVRDPQSGQLALAPKDALDRHRKQAAAAQGGAGLLGGGEGRRPQQRKKTRGAGVSAVPNLAEGLPRRRPPWEGGGDDEGAETVHVPPPPPRPAPAQPRMTTRSAETPNVGEPMELNNTERQVLRVMAEEVHRSASQGDDPEEFVHKMSEKYPGDVLKQIVSEYTDRQILRGIIQMEPRSSAATPGGQQFVLASFQLLRRTLS